MLLNCVSLEKTLESPLGRKGSHQSILKEINPKYFLEEMMQALVHCPSDEKSQLTAKDPDDGKIEGRKRRG